MESEDDTDDGCPYNDNLAGSLGTPGGDHT